MLHNETMNVWSHLLGALLFLLAVVYICVYLKPTSLHETDSLLGRWGNQFDLGRYDDLFCDKEDFVFPKPDQCPYLTKEVLDDILETDKLHKWHKDIGQHDDPHVGHFNLNYHSKAFEKADHYLHNAYGLLADPVSAFKK